MIYLDTSAFIKLVKEEAESLPLNEYLRSLQGPRFTSSKLLAVEARGTLRGAPKRLPRVDLMLDRVTQLEISDAVIETASRLPDPMLRTLDAIHLATALLIRDDIDVLLSYDDRLLAAAASHGLPTTAPG
ncbi:MAG TPA: type II toxin-antitoxin system VapC family toxin [Pseudonocardia sp.]|uniref:type II toxin-antitoxin system VapC family toxin n=1 Tax=Pseudonocardia sp. TaxID=60912 RepID=UPI002CEEEC6F|nr:type II toxin-antitoxin system VapC family toxin [Pseudonocardia sp.]HTF49139.1 type II toxin-antitoxin system VapC family toxin [Pseudonocardia sp.]